MAITKTIEDDQFEIIGQYKHLQIRTAVVVKEDGEELSRKFSRRVLEPGKLDASDNFAATDVSGESTEIQGITSAIWTDAVKDAWKSKLIADKNAKE
tara:strand:- start:18995 stop:19285 length:291 start_codon:yes stop_codon:yes gene_type:complete